MTTIEEAGRRLVIAISRVTISAQRLGPDTVDLVAKALDAQANFYEQMSESQNDKASRAS